MRHLLLVLFSFAAVGCAQLHHVQIGDIDNTPGFVRKPIDIKVSESGINIQEAASIVRGFNDKAGQGAEKIAAVIGLFQMGPRTGNPVYVKDYAKNLIQVVYEKCPSGRLTNLSSIRETRKYPVVSGEIVKITGVCLLPKEG